MGVYGGASKFEYGHNKLLNINVSLLVCVYFVFVIYCVIIVLFCILSHIPEHLYTCGTCGPRTLEL